MREPTPVTLLAQSHTAGPLPTGDVFTGASPKRVPQCSTIEPDANVLFDNEDTLGLTSRTTTAAPSPHTL